MDKGTSSLKWATFIANRMVAIQELVSEEYWRYMATQKNLTDLATRGISVEDYKEKSLWWHEPSWLRSSSETWLVMKKPRQTLLKSVESMLP